MKLSEENVTLADALRTLIDGAPAPGPAGTVRWDLIIDAASAHMVTPALALCWQEADVPEDIRDYFDAALELNARRNRIMLRGLQKALEALRSASIDAVLLKGAAMLADGLYPHVGARVLGDLDILVPQEAVGDALDALSEAGFRASAPAGPAITHDLPMMVDADSGAGVELHRWVLPPWLSSLAPAEDVLARAEPLAWCGGTVLLPCATDRIAHLIAHCQLHDRGYVHEVPPLRQMLDLALLVDRKADRVDRDELDSRFRAAGFAHVLEDTLAQCAVLLGRPEVAAVPMHSGRSGTAALVEYGVRERMALAALMIRKNPGLLLRKVLRRLFRTLTLRW